MWQALAVKVAARLALVVLKWLVRVLEKKDVDLGPERRAVEEKVGAWLRKS